MDGWRVPVFAGSTPAAVSIMGNFGAFELDCGCVVTRRGGRLSRTCAEVRELLDLQDLYIEKGDAEAVEMYRNAVTRHLVEGIDFTAGG